MSNTEEVTFEAPVKKKVAKKGKPAKKAVAAPKSTAPFPGLTRTACAEACNAKACAISGKPYCAHPCKGGLQTADMNGPAALAAMRRLQNARAQIDVRIDPDRFK